MPVVNGMEQQRAKLNSDAGILLHALGACLSNLTFGFCVLIAARCKDLITPDFSCSPRAQAAAALSLFMPSLELIARPMLLINRDHFLRAPTRGLFGLIILVLACRDVFVCCSNAHTHKHGVLDLDVSCS